MSSRSFLRGPVLCAVAFLSLLFLTPCGQAQVTITALKSEVSALAFSPDGKTLAAADDSFDLTLWQVASGQPAGKFTGLATRCPTVAWAPDGKSIYGTTGNDWIAWEIGSGKEKKIKAEMTRTSPRAIALSPDGRLLAATGQGVLKVWETATGKALGEYEPHPNYGIAAVTFSPDGRTVCTASSDRSAQLTDAATGKAGARFTCERRALAAAFAPNGQTLFVTDEAGLLHQFDVASGQDKPAPAIRSLIKQIAVSRDGKYVACAGSATLRLWNTAASTWHEFRLTDTVEGATAVAFSPDGTLLACADAPGRVKILPVAQILAGK